MTRKPPLPPAPRPGSSDRAEARQGHDWPESTNWERRPCTVQSVPRFITGQISEHMFLSMQSEHVDLINQITAPDPYERVLLRTSEDSSITTHSKTRVDPSTTGRKYSFRIRLRSRLCRCHAIRPRLQRWKSLSTTSLTRRLAAPAITLMLHVVP